MSKRRTQSRQAGERRKFMGIVFKKGMFVKYHCQRSGRKGSGKIHTVCQYVVWIDDPANANNFEIVNNEYVTIVKGTKNHLPEWF